MEEHEDLLTVMQLQAAELARVIQESADFELACELQLAEAIAVSAAMAMDRHGSAASQPGDVVTLDEENADTHTDEEESGMTAAEAPSGDRKAALTEQHEEMERLNQLLEDEAEALKEQARLDELEEVAKHDGRFSRFLSSLSEREWEDKGMNLDDPYTFSSKEAKASTSSDDRGLWSHKRRCAPIHDETLSINRANRGKALMWEPAVAAAFLVEPLRPELERTYLGMIVEEFRSDGRAGCSRVSEDDRPICDICAVATMESYNSTVVSPECNHQFCMECLQTYGEATVKSGKSHIPCPQPDCKELWSTDMCEKLLSPKTLMIITQRQIEDAFPESQRVYCPFPDCSILLLKPDAVWQPFSSSHPHPTVIGGVECHSCNRYFCYECKVPWHGDLTCEEFQSMPPDERSAHDFVLLQGLAKQQNWQRCKRCGYVVELSGGCAHITCRCGSEFCYSCGATWSHGHVCR